MTELEIRVFEETDEKAVVLTCPQWLYQTLC